MATASDLPPLAVRGRTLVRLDTGAPVRLRGVNRSGLEYADPAAAGAEAVLASIRFDEGDLDRIAGWGARIVRIPFTQDFVFRGRGPASGADYVAAIDQVIAWAEARGIYTLLDLQWLDADMPHGVGRDGSINRVPPLPIPETVDLWRTLALRYRDRPSVLFDLFNEPHTPMASDDSPLVGVRPDGGFWRLPARVVSMDEWQPWALRLVDAIRGVHPAAVVFVSGTDWAFDLRGFPLRDRAGRPLDGVVYSTHVYPWCRAGLLGPAERHWTRAFGRLAREFPVFAGEFGGGDGDLDWGLALVGYLEACAVGWTAWSWCDWPPLLRDHRAGDGVPSAFGAIVRAGLDQAGLDRQA